MSFFKKRFYLLTATILFILILILLLKNYSYSKKNYILTNEIIPKVSIFLIKKNYDRIEDINSRIVNDIYLSKTKKIILDFLKKEKSLMLLNFANNEFIKNLKISTGITYHDRIFFNFSFETSELLNNNKENTLITEYISLLNNKFKLKIKEIFDELDYFGKSYVFKNQPHMHPYGLEDIELVILYESSIILNNYIKYFVTLIYLMLLIILYLSLKQNFHRLKTNYND